MRLLIEAGVVFILVLVGWKQPFGEHYESIFPPAAEQVVAETPAPPAAIPVPLVQPVPQTPARPTAKRDNSWMWKQTKMDAAQPATQGSKKGK